jgi:cell division protein FtsZ
MGIGVASGDHRAVDAAQAAIASPLLETSIEGARAALINITGGPDLTLAEVHEATELIQQATDAEDANIIFGIVQDPRLQDEVRITVLATGFDQRNIAPPARAAVGATQTRAQMTTNAGPAPEAKPDSAPPPPRTPADNDVDIPAFLRRR